MNASGSLSLAHSAIGSWSNGVNGPGRRPTGIVIALVVHGLAAWLVLSGTGVAIVQKAFTPPPITLMPPQEPEPPRTRPTEPQVRRAATQQPQPTPILVPEPEQPAVASGDAPVLANQPGEPAELPARPGTSSGPQSAPGPRGFGSITNRAECSAAFAQSFPREARRNAQHGAVTLQVRVAASGGAEAAEVLNANPRRVFDRAALGVILSGVCRFESDSAGYIAVLEINYRLSGDAPD